MFTAILLATILVTAEGNNPPVIHRDSLNEVNWPTNHEYAVHDHDADQENQPDDGERYFTILVPTVTQESVQDHQIQQSDHGKDQVSVEVNGDSGLVDHSLDSTSSVSFVIDDELLHHGDFDKVKPKPALPNVKSYNNDIDLNYRDTTFSSVIPLKDLIGQIRTESILESQGDLESGNNEHEKELQVGDIVLTQTNDENVSEHTDPSSADSSNISNVNHRSTNLDISDPLSSDKENDDEGIDRNNSKNTFFESTAPKESELLFSKEIPCVTTPQTIVLQEEDQEQRSASTTVANTPLIKVHLLEESSERNGKKEYTDSLLSSQHSRRNKIKSIKDSPITRISKASQELNPPKLEKDVSSKPMRRRVLIDVKKRARPRPKSEDSAVSSTTDSLSSTDLEDDLEDDIQNSPQEEITNIDPIDAQDQQQENLLLYGPPIGEEVPVVPISPTYPEEYPSKIHQPVLHHIVHALLRPPSIDDEEFPGDDILHRYSPHFVPYPAFLDIPY